MNDVLAARRRQVRRLVVVVVSDGPVGRHLSLIRRSGCIWFELCGDEVVSYLLVSIRKNAINVVADGSRIPDLSDVDTIEMDAGAKTSGFGRYR